MRTKNLHEIEMANRISLVFALAKVLSISKQEPHKVFHLKAMKMRCQECNRRHVFGFAAFDEGKADKDTVFSVYDGEVMPRRRM